jgi:alkanesulfonate monooxygenase SsuD/methylene tetrahydromethanopterin reductase-like flavin-dependent oxidoreductase (luciferase family)
MTDLIFGVGVPTAAGPGADPVAQAREAERLGYDFVSAADHPCGADPSFDTPTMLTWIAAHTSRISVASRVLAVPFRRPALVAKAAASLDALSGGRFILGLGGGYDDAEIAALGGPVPSARAKVDGLAEAVRIIRGAWTEDGFGYAGAHYSVRDLTMEPKPGRRVPVWMGTFGPRALAVTGALADGWIPSLGFADPADLPAMRHRIDEAARAAGRDPAEIRGVFNVNIRVDPGAAARDDIVTGSPVRVADQLRRFLDLGFTGLSFIPAGPGRADQIRRIAEEVIPSVRDAVSRT